MEGVHCGCNGREASEANGIGNSIYLVENSLSNKHKWRGIINAHLLITSSKGEEEGLGINLGNQSFMQIMRTTVCHISKIWYLCLSCFDRI